MTDYASLAKRITSSLTLDTTPVALSIVDTAPAGHTRPSVPISAGCQFWELGADTALVTTAEDHKNCAIGIHTHNLDGVPPTQMAELTATLQAMQGLDYVRAEEVAAIPVLGAEPRMVAYTPLPDCREEPAAVLVLANAAQGLVLTEAIARVDGGAPAALGRPACALIPAVVNAGRAASSLGCCGARAYLNRLEDGIAVWALPGAKLEAYAAEIEVLGDANDTLRAFHARRRADIEAGKEPSVGESLARLAD